MRLDERVAILEEKARDTDSWIEAHEKVTARLLANTELMLTALNRYNWIARGVMGALLFIGMIGGWLMDKAHVMKHMVKSWLQ